VATVIGALPFDAPEAAAFALDQLPQFPCAPAVELDATRLGVDDVADSIGDGLVGLLEGLRGQTVPVVFSLTGPVTLARSLQRDGIDDSAAIDRAGRSVVEVAEWLVASARDAVPGAPTYLFLTEPDLANSMHPTFPIPPSGVEQLVAATVRALEASTTVGVQVAGRADWSMLLRTGIGALAAPVGAQLDCAASDVGRFLASGGLIAWGAVPVDEPLGVSTERLWKRLSAAWTDLARAGVDPMLMRERSIITPAGALSSFGPGQVERVVDLAQQLATRVWNQMLGMRRRSTGSVDSACR
jgi:hypothetical protein